MGSTSKAEKQEKKRKQREDAIDDALVAEDDQPKTKKRKRDSEPALDGQDTQDADDAKQKKKKDKKHKERSAVSLAEEDDQPVDKPKRKSKKRDSAAAAATAEPPASEDADNSVHSPSKKEKKKRKDKSDKDTSGTKRNESKYPDPAGDETLSDQAQKGLAYAHSYAIQSDWKFNKARQNWLMKHIYDPAMVPDSYVRMVVHYLKSIKGHALEHMRKTCQTMIEPPTDGKPPDETTADSVTEVQIARAAALLKKLPKSTSAPVAEDE